MNAAVLFADAKNSLLTHAVAGYRPGQRVIARGTAVFAVNFVGFPFAFDARSLSTKPLPHRRDQPGSGDELERQRP